LASKPVATVSSRLVLKPDAMVFSNLASKLVVTVCEWFGLKTTRTASKPVTTFSSSLTSKPIATVFPSLASKLVVMVSSGLASKPMVGVLVEPQI
jgi:hypothetical protein